MMHPIGIDLETDGRRAIGQAEREGMLERQREGSARPSGKAGIRGACRLHGDCRWRSSD